MGGSSSTPGGGLGSSPSCDAVASLVSWVQEREEEGKQALLEVFLSGGALSHKKACLDLSRMHESGDGAVIVRINVPIDQTSNYTVFIPKKLV
jgi:hypothetical protein